MVGRSTRSLGRITIAVPYVPIDLPAQTPPRVTSLLRRLERQYLAEVHCMLRLPIPNYRLSGNAGLPIAQVLLNVISGISTTLFRHKGGSGAQFKGLLERYYPWDLEPADAPSPKQASKLIYDVFRNPLTHNLGRHLFGATTPKVKIKRFARANGAGGPTEAKITRWERSRERPPWAHTVIARTDATVLFVEPLYWGVRVMLARLVCDQLQMHEAEQFLEKKGYAA